MRRIVVIRPGGLGDVVRAVPALRQLRAAYPAATIDAVAAAPARDLLDACPYVDRVVGPAELEPGRVDIAISLADPDEPLEVGVGDIDAELRIEWQAAGEHAPVPNRPAWPERLDRSSRMLRIAWLVGGGVPDHELGLWPTLADRNGAARLLAGIERPVAILHPGAGAPERRWPAACWARVVDLLDGLGLQPVLVGREDDAEVAEAVQGCADAAAIDLVGRSSVGELVGLLERSAMFVGGDSGPAALAAALSVRSVIVGPASNLEHVPRPGVLELVGAGACDDCGERACTHPSAPAAQIGLDPVLAVASVVAARASERWREERLER